MRKPFIVANVREILDAIANEEITFSKGVELLNDIAFTFYNENYTLKILGKMNISQTGWLLTAEISLTEGKITDRIAIKLNEVVSISESENGCMVFLKNGSFFNVNEDYEELMFYIIDNII